MAYNISLLNTIKPALDESLSVILDQLSKCDNGEILLSDLNILGETQRLKSALASINKKGLEAGANVLLKAIDGLRDVDIHGWDGMQSQKIVVASKELVTEIKSILDNLVNHVEVKSVFLYSYIDKLNKAMGDFSSFSPNDLFEFEINDPLSKTAYSAKDLDTLKKQLKSMKPLLDQVLDAIIHNASSIDLQNAINGAIRVASRFQKLRHRRGYFPFWVLLKARLALIGIVGVQENDLAVLKEAFFEIRKFADGQKNPSEATLNELVKPFIDKELERHVYMGSPAFKELDEMLSLESWFVAKKQAMNTTGMDEKKNFQLHLDEIQEALKNLEIKWNALDDLMANKVTGKRVEYAINDVEKSIDGLYSVKIWLESLHVEAVFKIISEMRPHLDDIDPSVSIEFARLLNLLGEGVRTFNQSAEYQEALDEQSKRLTLAFQRQTRELEKVPLVDIGAFSKEDRLAKSLSLWAKTAKGDLNTVEGIIKEWLQKETVVDLLPNCLPILSGFAGAFAGFQKEKASEVTSWILSRLESVTAGKKIDGIELIPLAFGSVSYYINALARNDLSADTENEVFANAYKALFDKDLNAVESNEESEDIGDIDFSGVHDVLDANTQEEQEQDREDTEQESNEEQDPDFETHENEEQEEGGESYEHADVVETEPENEGEQEDSEESENNGSEDEQEQEEATTEDYSVVHHEVSHDEHDVEENGRQTHFDENEESNCDFREESEGVLAALSESIENIYLLLTNGQQSMSDQEVLTSSEDIRRYWHTFKGSAAMCGFMKFSAFAKFMEETVSEFVDSNGSWTIDQIKWLENGQHQATEYLEKFFAKKVSLNDDILVTEAFPESHQEIEDHGSLDDIFSFEENEGVQQTPIHGVDVDEDEEQAEVREGTNIHENVVHPSHEVVEPVDEHDIMSLRQSLKDEEHVAEQPSVEKEDAVEIAHSKEHEAPIHKEDVVFIQHEPEVQVEAPVLLQSESHHNDVQSQKQEIWGVILEKMKLIEDTQSQVTELFVKLAQLDTMRHQ